MAASPSASRPVASTQTGPHHDLPRLAARHAARAFGKPAATYSLQAFEHFLRDWNGGPAPVLDAGCGTGDSTLALARLHPARLVVGVDQSAHRLARGRARADAPANALLLRADVIDFWSLAAAAGVRLFAHYLLYPNPWPKPAQVMRRWPAHPAFPFVLALGGTLECRANWRVYIEEFALAVRLITGHAAEVAEFVPESPLTPFERKYLASGHRLYRAAVNLGGGAVADPQVGASPCR